MGRWQTLEGVKHTFSPCAEGGGRGSYIGGGCDAGVGRHRNQEGTSGLKGRETRVHRHNNGLVGRGPFRIVPTIQGMARRDTWAHALYIGVTD
eukprot:scaffold5554_cov130-Isochrysis_galbana.AAC.1